MLAKYRVVAIANSILFCLLMIFEIISIYVDFDKVILTIVGFTIIIPNIYFNFYTAALLIKERRIKNENN